MKKLALLLLAVALKAQTNLPGPIIAIPDNMGSPDGVCSSDATQVYAACVIADITLTQNAAIRAYNTTWFFDRTIETSNDIHAYSASAAIDVGSVSNTGVGIHLLASSKSINIDSTSSVDRFYVDPKTLYLRDVGTTTDYVRLDSTSSTGKITTSSAGTGVIDSQIDLNGFTARTLKDVIKNCLEATTAGLIVKTLNPGLCLTTNGGQTVIGAETFSGGITSANIFATSDLGPSIGTAATRFNDIFAFTFRARGNASSTVSSCTYGSLGFTCNDGSNVTTLNISSTALNIGVSTLTFSARSGGINRCAYFDTSGNLLAKSVDCSTGTGTVTSAGSYTVVAGGVNSFSGGTFTASTGLSTIQTVVCTIYTAGGAATTEGCQVKSGSGGSVTFLSTTGAGSSAFLWFAIGN